MSVWARPLLVGLLAIGLLATAGVAIAAPTTIPGPAAGLLPPPILVSAPVHVSPPPAARIVEPSQTSPLTIVPAELPAARPAVAPQAKAVAVAPKPKVAPKPAVVAAKPKAVVKRVTVSYSGLYHLWIPALGLSRSIFDWGCNGGLIPNRVEYWGCAGRNNLYLLGHAWGVFAKIHDGYHSGAMQVGLVAYYADKSGKVHRYRISQIRHVANSDYATWSNWAMAASSTPIITLQTCDGATSAYRILVRLVPV
jgi:hypothetical protein